MTTNQQLCLRCLAGNYRNGVCDHCGKPRPEKENPSALPPQTILRGRFLLGYPLGIGGFGITYAALDLQNNARVAVKELFPGASVYRQQQSGLVLPLQGQEKNFAVFQTGFRKEAHILAQLQGNPGVVRIYQAFAENNTFYYVMEFLEGEDLRSRLKREGPMDWETLEPKLRILLDGLEGLHQAGMIHRDISPDNIFLTRDGGCCLIDFGSVRAYQAVDHFTTHLKQCFAPWEQFFSQSKQGPWTDIYALCVTVYYTLTGTLPPNAPSRRQKDTLVPIRKLCPQLPKSVGKALTDGMAVEAADRIQSVKELRSRLFPQTQPKSHWMEVHRQLTCLSGAYQGGSWHLAPGEVFCFGRRGDCQVVYPDGTPGVSRVQCTLYISDTGAAYLRDENSTYGTYRIINGKAERIAPGQWFPADGSQFGFGKQELFQIQ